MSVSFFRYPGGKSKLKAEIVSKLHELFEGKSFEYREPFFGGGSIGLKLIQDCTNLNQIWINDADPGIACLWISVIRFPEALKKRVLDFQPTVEQFYKIKKELLHGIHHALTTDDTVEYGFKKLAIHQISYSGLGTKSGGPLGGELQKSDYKIDCRWSPSYICKKIDLLNKKFRQFSVRDNQCSNLDFLQLLEDDSRDAVIYLDPPYYIKGNDLYQHGFTHTDHLRLSEALKATKHRWLLSYDDCPEVRALYEWASVEVIDGVSYSITALKNKETGERLSRSKSELLITNYVS